ncbi:hypothetical protein FHE65_06450, partial [Mumia zhuanghuii]
MHRSIAGWINHRFTPALTIVFWVLVVGLLGSTAGQLTDVQENEAENWLPTSAESTKALEAAEEFSSPNLIPAVVVYEREGGLQAADLAAAQEDARTFGQRDDL